jgi:hypothetical protein
MPQMPSCLRCGGFPFTAGVGGVNVQEDRRPVPLGGGPMSLEGLLIMLWGFATPQQALAVSSMAFRSGPEQPQTDEVQPRSLGVLAEHVSATWLRGFEDPVELYEVKWQ